MKNFLIIFSLCLLSAISFAQVTTPRFGVGKNQDNSGNVLTWNLVSTADVAGADTIYLTPSAYSTIVQPINSILDSLSYSLKSLGKSYLGDRIEFSFINSSGSGHKIKFVGTGWQFSSTGSSISLTTAKRANISFRFDGVAWVETGRVTQ
jgi:hypothetical protein